MSQNPLNFIFLSQWKTLVQFVYIEVFDSSVLSSSRCLIRSVDSSQTLTGAWWVCVAAGCDAVLLLLLPVTSSATSSLRILGTGGQTLSSSWTFVPQGDSDAARSRGRLEAACQRFVVACVRRLVAACRCCISLTSTCSCWQEPVPERSIVLEAGRGQMLIQLFLSAPPGLPACLLLLLVWVWTWRSWQTTAPPCAPSWSSCRGCCCR